MSLLIKKIKPQAILLSLRLDSLSIKLSLNDHSHYLLYPVSNGSHLKTNLTLVQGYVHMREGWSHVHYRAHMKFTGGGGCLPHCMLGYTPPQADTPPVTPLGRHPPLGILLSCE